MASLQESSLLVSLHIRTWQAKKVDAQLSREVEQNHNMTNAGRYTKDIITADQLRPITQASNNLRTHHLTNTLPWSDKGERMLPSRNYFQYTSEQQRLREKFDDAVKEFIDNYDDIVANAQIRLNGKFDAAEYPDKTELPERFKSWSVMMPVPDSDFRVNLSESDIAELKKQTEAEISKRFKDAQAENWERIKESLQQMKQVFSDPGKKVYTSLFDNLADMAHLLPRLNIANDPQLEEICQDLKQLIVDPNQVRQNQSIRSDKAKEVEQIMARFSSYF